MDDFFEKIRRFSDVFQVSMIWYGGGVMLPRGSLYEICLQRSSAVAKLGIPKKSEILACM